jgi:hypothetical protein
MSAWICDGPVISIAERNESKVADAAGTSDVKVWT